MVTAIDCGSTIARVTCWGILGELDDFMALWCASDHDWKLVEAELGAGTNPAGLTQTEARRAIDAEDAGVGTPDEAWAALARYRLIGERS